MNQRPLVESPPQSSPTPYLKPGLQAVLASLDVQLDRELAQYRRSGSGRQQTPSRQGLGRYHRKPLNLISVAATEGKTQPQATKTTTPPQQPFVSSQSPKGQIEQTQQLHNTPSSSSPLAIAKAEPVQDETAQLAHPAGEVPDAGSLVDSSANRVGPDDYLESSEALLRSLAEEEAQSQTEHNPNSLLTPLTVGSMLLLLLASATLGYIVMNPSTLQYLGFNRDPSSPSTTPTSGASADVPPLSNSPNLASREFVDLDLNTLIAVKPKFIPTPPKPKPLAASTPKITPSATPSPVITSYINPTVTAVPQPQATAVVPVPQVRVQPLVPLPQLPQASQKPASTRKVQIAVEPTLEKSSDKPASTQKAAASQPTKNVQAQNGYYHLVTDYKGDRSLEQARQMVSDAYLSPKGTLIYLGALESQEEAQKRIQELQKNGIQARIYQP